MGRVVVSCAHVGQSGAVSPCGRIVESTYSKRIVTQMARRLEELGHQVVVLEVMLEEKAQRVDEAEADCAVEPHLNALRKQDAADEDGDGDFLELIPDQRGRGTMALHAASSVAGRELALAVTGELAAAMPWTTNHGPQPCPGPMVARQRVAFLQDTRTVACLVEALFLTHPDEIAFLLRPTTPALLGGAIAAGVDSWLTARLRADPPPRPARCADGP
jgi:N-acetylmuramoyl-L-alanine amidase